MFSGIIEECGVVKTLTTKDNLAVLELKFKTIGKSLKLGDSVSINGTCLTVTAKKDDAVSFDMDERNA